MLTDGFNHVAIVTNDMDRLHTFYEEVFDAGDAFYLPPGHVPIVRAGSAYVQFSPSEDLRAVAETMARNAEAMQTA